MSFADELKKAAAKDVLRLHTPGHKGGLTSLDLTELTDGSFPDEALAAAQKRAAEIYGAKHAYYLSCGSSQGVKAAVFYAGTSAVVDINSHRSVFDGFRLAGKQCIVSGGSDVRPIAVSDIERAITKDVGAVIVTTPTYYGFCADVDGIAEYCRKRGLLFIADSAHGAHFGFSPRLPKSVAPVCDICNMSTHKTLCALTQTAVITDNLGDSDSDRLFDAVSAMGTTSPSYLLYASIDHGITKAASDAAAYERLYDPITDLRKELPFLNNDDFTRLVLDCSAIGIDPHRLNGSLCARGVFPEMNDGKRLVFIFTAADEPRSVETLRSALISAITENK